MCAPCCRDPPQGSVVTSVAAGAEHSVAATSAGEVFAWGWGRYGNLGDGSSPGGGRAAGRGD